MSKNRIIGIAAAIISAGTFGLIPLFSIPLVKSGMSETSILFYRCLFSAIAIGIVSLPGLLNKKRSMSAHTENKTVVPDARALLRLVAMSCIYCCTAIALLLSYRYISSGVVTTIHFLYPIIVAVLMALIYKEKCSVQLFIASVLTMLGVASLSWTGSGFMNTTGILLALSTAVSYAVYIVGLNHRKIKSLDGKTVMFFILLVSALIFGTISLAGGGISNIPHLSAWLNLIMLALLPTIVSNIALLKAVKYAGATTTSILGSAEPIVAVLFGVSVFSEKLTATGILGLLIIIGAVTYVIVSGDKKKSYA